jgi:hypothetical protein
MGSTKICIPKQRMNFLTSCAENLVVKASKIYIYPMFFGRHDRATRLIFSLVVAKRECRGIDLSSGRAVMTPLRVDEFVDAMVGFVKNRWASQRQPLPEINHLKVAYSR